MLKGKSSGNHLFPIKYGGVQPQLFLSTNPMMLPSYLLLGPETWPDGRLSGLLQIIGHHYESTVVTELVDEGTLFSRAGRQDLIKKPCGLWIQPVKMCYPWICILFGITTVSINTLKLVILKRFIFSRMWKILIGIKVRETTKIVRKGNHPDWLTNFSPSYIPLQ